MANKVDKLYKYLAKSHTKKPADIHIWEYVENPLKHPPFIKSGKHNSTFLCAEKLQQLGLIEIKIQPCQDRAFLKLINPSTYQPINQTTC